MKGLARRTRQGMVWTVLGSTLSFGLRLAVLAALGRILSKRDFGVIAAAMTVIQFGNTIRDLGVGLALVQRKELDQEHVEAAFTFSVLLGLAIGGTTFLLAGPIGAFYKIPDAVPIVRMLSGLFVLRGVAMVPAFMCRRAMSFRALAIIDLAGYVAGAALSISLALLGFGPWSLAGGYLLETAINVGALVVLSPPPPRLRMHRKHLRDLLGFGVGQSLASIANYFANQGDYMVVGHVLGAAQLGVYQRAYELMRVPANVFSNVAGSVLFSAFAKVQDDPERAGRAMRRATFACALVILPASVGLIVLAPEVIHIVLGPKWAAAVWPFRIMAMSMLFRTTYKLGAIVGRSSGEVFRIAGWQILYAILVIGGALVSVRWGILGVACTTSFGVLVVFLGLTSVALTTTRTRAGEIIRAHLVPAVYMLLVGAVAWGLATALRSAAAPYVVVALATTAAGGLAFVALAAHDVRQGRGDFPWIWETVRGRARRRKVEIT